MGVRGCGSGQRLVPKNAECQSQGRGEGHRNRDRVVACRRMVARVRGSDKELHGIVTCARSLMPLSARTCRHRNAGQYEAS